MRERVSGTEHHEILLRRKKFSATNSPNLGSVGAIRGDKKSEQPKIVCQLIRWNAAEADVEGKASYDEILCSHRPLGPNSVSVCASE